MQTHLEGLPGGGQGAPGQEKVQEAKAQGAAEPKEQRSGWQRDGREAEDVARGTHCEIRARNEHWGSVIIFIF